MRENKRYLLVRCSAPRATIESALLEMLGVLGFSKLGFQFIETKHEEAIIAVNREMLEQVRAAFALSQERVQIMKVSGTLKGLRK